MTVAGSESDKVKLGKRCGCINCSASLVVKECRHSARERRHWAIHSKIAKAANVVNVVVVIFHFVDAVIHVSVDWRSTILTRLLTVDR